MKRIKLFCGYNESETGYKNVLGFYNLIRRTWMYYEDSYVYVNTMTILKVIQSFHIIV